MPNATAIRDPRRELTVERCRLSGSELEKKNRVDGSCGTGEDEDKHPKVLVEGVSRLPSARGEASTAQTTTSRALQQANKRSDEVGDENLKKAQWALFFVAFTQLMGYNFILVCSDHWRQPENLGADWETSSLFPYAFSNVAFALLYTVITEQRKFRAVKGDEESQREQVEKTRPRFFAFFTFRVRWFIACWCNALVYVPLLILATAFNEIWSARVAMVLLGLGNSWFQNCGASLCTSLKSEKVMTLWSLGNALSGVPSFVFTVVLVCCQASMSVLTIYVILSFCAAVLGVCYFLLPCAFLTNPLLRAPLEREDDPDAADAEGEDQHQEVEEVEQEVERTRRTKMIEVEGQNTEEFADANLARSEETAPLLALDLAQHKEQGNINGTTSTSEPRDIFGVFADDWSMYTGMFLLFFTTFCVFPAMQFKTRPDDSAGLGNNFHKILLGMFTIGDVGGRYLPSLLMPPRWLFLPLVLARCLGFGALFVWGAKQPLPAAATFTTLFFYGLTMGYFASVAFIQGGNAVTHPVERAKIGPILSNALLVGILCGTIFSAFALGPILATMGL